MPNPVVPFFRSLNVKAPGGSAGGAFLAAEVVDIGVSPNAVIDAIVAGID
jgi:hypothetical protein